MSNNEADEYPVGYRKPPAKSQFRKGVSGNPEGRPKGSKNLNTVLISTLNETVIVNENGHRKRITKLEAMTKQLVNKAASGDPRATQLLMTMVGELDRDTQPHAPETLAEADHKVISMATERMRHPAASSPESAAPSKKAA